MGRLAKRMRRKSQAPRQTRFQFESLEQRRLLAIDIVGTAGDDSIAIIGTDTGFYASVNGQVTNYTTSGLTDVNVDGLGGNDSVQVHKIHGAATLGALTGLVDGNLFRVMLSNFETQYVFWAPDVRYPFGDIRPARLTGTSGNDQAYQFDTHSIMHGILSGTSYFNEVVGFGNVTFQGFDGSDTAISCPNGIALPPVTLSFDAATQVTTLYQNLNMYFFGGMITFEGFEQIYAFANPFARGHTTSRFTGTSGDDVFYSLPTTSILMGSGYFYQQIGYDRCTANGGGGVDSALMYGDAPTERFDANPDQASFARPDFMARAIATGFDRVYAFATPGGNDSANFNDTAAAGAGDDVLFATSEYSLLYRPGSYLIQAVGFAEVEVTSTSGYDTAIILDRPGGNQLTALTDSVEINYFGRSKVSIKAFDIVYANGLYGGVNRKATASTPQFPIVYAGIWFA